MSGVSNKVVRVFSCGTNEKRELLNLREAAVYSAYLGLPLEYVSPRRPDWFDAATSGFRGWGDPRWCEGLFSEFTQHPTNPGLWWISGAELLADRPNEHWGQWLGGILAVPKPQKGFLVPTELAVPLSAERRSCAALGFALELGRLRGLPVDLFHFHPEHGHLQGDVLPPLLERAPEWIVSDYAHRWPEVLRECLPLEDPAGTWQEVRGIYEYRGRLRDGVRALKRKETTGLLEAPWWILEWKGDLSPGRGRFLREFLKGAVHPFLLFREHSHPFNVGTGVLRSQTSRKKI